MSFIVNCNNNEKIEVDINNENVQKSKFILGAHDLCEEGGSIVIPFSYNIIEYYINGYTNFIEMDIETVYNFLNYLIVDNEVMINYLSYILYKIDFEDAKYYIDNIVDKSFLKILKQKKDIIKCVENNDIVGVLIRIKSGADINANDEDGETDLHVASKYGHAEIAKVLLESGADVNAKNKVDWTALWYASQYCHIKVVFLLLESGADVNVKDIWGCTALHFASENGHIEVVKVLLEYDVDINVKDNWSQTALHRASWKGHNEIVKLLK